MMKTEIESKIKRLFSSFDLELSRANDRYQPDFYSHLLTGALAVTKPLNIVQIGANDGKHGDPIYEFVKSAKEHTNIILVEPVGMVIPHLREHYNYHPSAEIFNCCISWDGTCSVNMYRIKQEYSEYLNTEYGESWPKYRVLTGVTTTNKSQLIQWVSENVDIERVNITPESVIESFEVDAIQPNQLIAKSQNVNSIDVLQIDAEGADHKIAYSFLEDNLYPSIINIERANITSEPEEEYAEMLVDEGYTIYDYHPREKLGVML